jgi:hypothetical protein
VKASIEAANSIFESPSNTQAPEGAVALAFEPAESYQLEQWIMHHTYEEERMQEATEALCVRPSSADKLISASY